MTISAADVRHIARLARLELTGEEVERLRGELSAILEYVARLEPLAAGRAADPGRPQQPLREDRAQPYPDARALQAQAPDFADGFFRVPRVVE
ncbi:MAG: Asp-tRNA(Asn)/Glu-tRNA(Gln) amidotransferase subunit GatC [Gemmatimonadetes bacterium]|nr:Asp-tRNA(Asn)/Glu-tRNA(Gln) amidotransferase subunit GatC [Gemmatimonadota bacterium]